MTVEEKNLSDGFLIGNIRDGDREAFDRLVGKYNKPLMGFIRARVKGCNECDLEDISQTVWEDVCKKLRLSAEEGGFDPLKGGFYTYLIRCIAEYKVRQWLGSRKRYIETPVKFGEDEGDMRLPGTESEDDPYNAVELAEELHMRLKAYELLFRLTFLCGGYPHQLLAFGLTKLISGRRTNRAIEGNNLEFYNRNKYSSLAALNSDFRERYRDESVFGSDRLENFLAHLEPLETRLKLKIKDLMALDGASLGYNADIAEKTAADTLLANYCEKDNEAGARSDRDISNAISNWCYKVMLHVKNRVSGTAGGEYDVRTDKCGHCNFRRICPEKA